MPLTGDPQGRSALTAGGIVRFPMFDSLRYVPCSVSAGALAALAAREGISNIDPAELFARFHLEIEGSASAKYDQGEFDGDELVVGDTDIPKAKAL